MPALNLVLVGLVPFCTGFECSFSFIQLIASHGSYLLRSRLARWLFLFWSAAEYPSRTCYNLFSRWKHLLQLRKGIVLFLLFRGALAAGSTGAVGGAIGANAAGVVVIFNILPSNLAKVCNVARPNIALSGARIDSKFRESLQSVRTRKGGSFVTCFSHQFEKLFGGDRGERTVHNIYLAYSILPFLPCRNKPENRPQAVRFPALCAAKGPFTNPLSCSALFSIASQAPSKCRGRLSLPPNFVSSVANSRSHPLYL